MKVRGLQYKKDWNVDDFIGKNHLARIDKEQAAPIPGTQIRKEQGTALCLPSKNEVTLSDVTRAKAASAA